MTEFAHRTLAELHEGLEVIRRSPRGAGRIEMIVSRPAAGERVFHETAELSLETGLVGDNWKVRGSSKTPDKSAHPEMQITLMNLRAIDLIAGAPGRRALAGDQFYLDLDLSLEHLPAGSRLALGDAIIEITEPPHLGCVKFAGRFGNDALKFVNTLEARALRLRGAHAKVVKAGTVRKGEMARVVNSGEAVA